MGGGEPRGGKERDDREGSCLLMTRINKVGDKSLVFQTLELERLMFLLGWGMVVQYWPTPRSNTHRMQSHAGMCAMPSKCSSNQRLEFALEEVP